jgi:hypothetical protein
MISMSFFIAHKKGGSIASDPFKENIEDLINDWDLLDIKPIKGKYTWTNKRSGHGHIVSRLDRFLVHSSLLLQDDTFKSKILPSVTSYHKPISLLFQNTPDHGPLPFKFNPLLVKFLGIH